jgi:hypothetical protein
MLQNLGNDIDWHRWSTFFSECEKRVTAIHISFEAWRVLLLEEFFWINFKLKLNIKRAVRSVEAKIPFIVHVTKSIQFRCSECVPRIMYEGMNP